MSSSSESGKRRRRLWGGGAFLVVVTLLALISAPAQAARQINPPPNYFCGDYYTRTISIIPPRIWSSYNRPEQVLWVIGIERWNNVRQEWYKYGPSIKTWASFNSYGQGVTSWSGGRFANSKLNLSVSHAGYYRVGAAIGGNQGGVRWGGYIAGERASCYMR
jgi:hypothetical protein